MANITITSTSTSIKVEFGIYSASLERYAGVWRKENVHLKRGIDFVEVDIVGEHDWFVSAPNSVSSIPTLTVDSVDSMVILDNNDLYNKLSELI